jgi:hypothetical protein
MRLWPIMLVVTVWLALSAQAAAYLPTVSRIVGGLVIGLVAAAVLAIVVAIVVDQWDADG